MTRRCHLLSHVALLCKHKSACLGHYLSLSEWLERAIVFLGELLLDDGASLITLSSLSNCCLVALVDSCCGNGLVVCVLYRSLLFLSAYFRTHLLLVVVKSYRASSLFG